MASLCNTRDAEDLVNMFIEEHKKCEDEEEVQVLRQEMIDVIKDMMSAEFDNGKEKGEASMLNKMENALYKLS